jgi:hypothetical protein
MNLNNFMDDNVIQFTFTLRVSLFYRVGQGNSSNNKYP